MMGKKSLDNFSTNKLQMYLKDNIMKIVKRLKKVVELNGTCMLQDI